MTKNPFLLACLSGILLFSSYAIALEVPDMHLKNESETQDTTLRTSADKTNIKQNSQFELFVNTLLGKNIDKMPEKTSKGNNKKLGHM